MSLIEELRNTRLEKKKKLESVGMNPYPASVPFDFSLSYAKENFEDLEKTDKEYSISGRIMAIRGQGAILFVVLSMGLDKFQTVFKKDEIDAESFSLFGMAVDIGDFISVTGKFFITERGEKSLLAKSWVMASKSLLPLPEKWHGITDEDERYRKRYLDMLMDVDLKEIFVKKAKFWEATRSFLKERGFLEVETPTLEVTTGGAEARPFKTHHNDFDIDLFLRISVGELWQKRLMSAGFPKTFEIGRVYRNEGTSPDHLQEFTNMEFYASFMTLDEGKKMVRDLFIEIGEKVYGTTKFNVRGYEFDLKDEWDEIDYVEEIKKVTGINVLEDSEENMIEKLQELGVTFEGKNRERLTDSLWKYCRKKINGPAYLVNHPKLVAPLSRASDIDPRKTDMFQVILAGSELGRAHAELNDPIDQKNRFLIQQELLSKGDEEAMMLDMEYIEMLEYGMPPTFGFGFGERLFAILSDKPIRETQFFPLMRPKDNK